MNNNFAVTNIKYSIIIPHYDIPLLLERLLNTIPEREDIQVIVVDDCSPGNDTYLEEYAFLRRSNVEFHITRKNGGGGYARNEGLKYAKGKWLLFADADDLFTTGFDKTLDKYYNNEEEIIFFQIESVYSDNLSKHSERATGRIREHEKLLNHIKDGILRYKFIEPWAKMIRKDLVTRHKILFDETKVANDYFFSIQTGHYARQVKVMPDTIYILTQRKGSVSAGGWADSLENLQIRLQVIARAQFFLQSNDVLLTPMPIRGLMVLALKHYPFFFLKELYHLSTQKIPIIQLLFQMIFYAFGNKHDTSN